MIEDLTPEQEGRMAEYAARWTEIALCTDPADRPRAEVVNATPEADGSFKRYWLRVPDVLMNSGSSAVLCAWMADVLGSHFSDQITRS